MTIEKKANQVTMFPAQCRRLYAFVVGTNAAIGISQTGSVIHLDTGQEQFSIDAEGNTISDVNQSKE